MKIYTKTGDDGTTALFGGGRVPKDSLRVECYGTIDELNSSIGVAVSEIETLVIREKLLKIQNHLFNLGGELATPDESKIISRIENKDVGFLENTIDEIEKELQPLKQFILPGGTKGASLLNLSRTICRRAERLVTSLSKIEKISDVILVYLNRLSDLLFVLARYENKVKNVEDIPWQK